MRPLVTSTIEGYEGSVSMLTAEAADPAALDREPDQLQYRDLNYRSLKIG